MNAPLHNPAKRNAILDFFRGYALLVIFINHTPFNEAMLYTPSRFGLSDAAEIFVFCSGFVSAMAFGRCFERAGLWLGTVRVLYRCAQIYAVHIGLFILIALVSVLGNNFFTAPDYLGRLNLHYFFDETQEALPALAMLTYVPNYFDILPMYLVLLLCTPLIWAATRLHRSLGWLIPPVVYAAMWIFDLNLSADPRSDRPWFFNPFAWQLLFFTGFALGSRWITVRLQQTPVMGLCWAIVLLAMPLSHELIYNQVDWLRELRALLQPLIDKTDLGLLRWAHFLALAYLAASLLSGREAWLNKTLPAMLRKTGQQTLPVFMVGLALSTMGGMALDQLGHGALTLWAVNLGGCAILIGTAQGVAWVKSKPWKNVDPHVRPSHSEAWHGTPAASG